MGSGKCLAGRLPEKGLLTGSGKMPAYWEKSDNPHDQSILEDGEEFLERLYNRSATNPQDQSVSLMETSCERTCG
jgi:hypothetical protein